MARRPIAPPVPSAAPSADVSAVLDGASAPTLTQAEKVSPLFRSLRDIDRIEDPELRLAAALDRLDAISKLALGRERTVKSGEVIMDPDCNAAVKVEEVAHRLLSIEPRRVKLKVPDMSAFDKPALTLAKG